MAIHAAHSPAAGSSTAQGHPDTLVIVPMFNEASVITEVVADLRQVFSHVVCVDDGSGDDSAHMAGLAGAHVVSHPVNLGQGAALQTGLAYGLRHPFEYFVTFDADGQHTLADTLRMLDEARGGDVDIVLGSRFLGSGLAGMPVLRRVVLRAGVTFTRATTRLRLTDTHNGLRVMNRRTASILNLRLSGMAHASEILTTIARHHLRYTEVPVTVLYTDYSMAKGQSSINAVNILFDLLLTRARYAR